ncbi:MAG: hypothetical protein ABI878_11255 [Acidobacteriota bacterium]
MSNTKKTSMLTVKISPERLEEFRIAASMAGVSMSALISHFIASTVAAAKSDIPTIFSRTHEENKLPAWAAYHHDDLDNLKTDQ